jgi:hypothetical protein
MKEQQKQAGKPADKTCAAAPVLPWMRVPILIKAGTGVAIELVAGLDPRLKQALSGAGAR